MKVEKVHPFAEQFAMLTDEEIDELAASISEVGLLNPVVVNSENVLIDGRNRLLACEAAGVEPTFVVNDGDPVEIILAANVSRRHLTTGQKAMAIALGLIASDKRSKDAKGRWRFAQGALGAAVEAASSPDPGNSRLATRVGEAAKVADEHMALAHQVLDGSVSLDAAYREVMGKGAESTRTKVRAQALERQYADLAEAYRDGRLTLDEAEAKATKRDDDRIAEEAIYKHDSGVMLDRIQESLYVLDNTAKGQMLDAAERYHADRLANMRRTAFTSRDNLVASANSLADFLGLP